MFRNPSSMRKTNTSSRALSLQKARHLRCLSAITNGGTRKMIATETQRKKKRTKSQLLLKKLSASRSFAETSLRRQAHRPTTYTAHLTHYKEKLKPDPKVSPVEASKEEDDINRVLDDLNLSAENNRAFSISAESQELVRKFTVILKDLVNGVPTAYDDLVGLLEDSQGTLAKTYDHLPSFLKKLITQLPNKMTSNLAPELLAVATEAQALGKGEGSASGLSGAAKDFFKIGSLKDLVTKPGAVVGLLKTIMNALKLRWPAFMGTNVLLSLALFGKCRYLALYDILTFVQFFYSSSGTGASWPSCT